MNLDNETSQPTDVDADRSKYVQLHSIRRKMNKHDQSTKHKKQEGRCKYSLVTRDKQQVPNLLDGSVLVLTPSSIIRIHIVKHSILPFQRDTNSDEKNIALSIQGLNLLLRSRFSCSSSNQSYVIRIELIESFKIRLRGRNNSSDHLQTNCTNDHSEMVR